MRPNIVRALAVFAVLALTVMPVAAHDGSTGLGTASCSAVAPNPNQCTTGTHVRGPGGVGHTICLPACTGFTGTVHSTLEFLPTGVRVFSCVVLNGAVQTCNGQGSFPATGASFVHNCTAVGAGTFGCTITHN